MRLKRSGYKVKKDAKDFFNVVNFPVFKNLPRDEFVLMIFAIDELHVLTGIMKDITDVLLIDWGKNQFLKFLKKDLSINSDEYQLGRFVGNDVKKFLKNLDLLETKVPSHCQKYVGLLRKFEDVRISCF